MLRQRENGIWYADISIAGKKRVIRSCFTTDKAQAQELHDTMKAKLWRTVQLHEKPEYTWLDAIDLWMKLKGKKRSIEDDKDKLRWLGKHLNHLKLREINSAVLNKVRDAKLADEVSDTTINRYFALIRSMLNLCLANEMLDSVPSFVGRMSKEEAERVVYLTKKQANILYEFIPNSHQPMYRFALLTGLRKSNVFTLKWAQVDIERKCAWIKAEDAKGKKSISVPLNSQAMLIINEQSKITGKQANVFGGAKPIERKAWISIIKKSGIYDEIMREFGLTLRWHDLRHTWATWHVMNGTPLEVLQKMGGWKSYQMVLKYGHFAPAHLAQYAENGGF